MVLESILSPEQAERHPWEIVFFSIVFVSIGVAAMQYLNLYSSFLLVALVAIPSTPLILNLFNYEESEAEARSFIGLDFIFRHTPVVTVLAAYFIGLIIGFTFWFFFLPPQTSQTIFSSQIQELATIGATGNIAGFAVASTLEQAFETIFFHNLAVLAAILFFSFTYGAGSVLILIWNASIISTFISGIARKFVFNIAPEYSIISGLGYGFLGLIPHGTFELLAYLVAALAGGVLSSAVVRRAYEKGEFASIMFDVAKLTALSILLLAAGAFIEGQAIA